MRSSVSSIWPDVADAATRPRVLVAIPCYNCERQIPRVLAGFRDPALRARVDRIIVIDNRSTDRTAPAAREAAETAGLGDRFRLFRNVRNYGLGGSQKVAFLHALENGFDYVSILHGDDQATTGELADLISKAERAPGLAAVLGARFMPGSRLRGYSLLRIAGNRLLNALYSCVTGRRTFDLGSGLNLFRVDQLDPGAFLGFSDAFTFNMDLLLHLYSTRRPLAYVPITWSETDQVSNARTFRVGWITLLTLLGRAGGRRRAAHPPPAAAYASEALP